MENEIDTVRNAISNIEKACDKALNDCNDLQLKSLKKIIGSLVASILMTIDTETMPQLSSAEKQ
jgi:hypothetical protein